jgi:hypothetical protein
LRQDPKATRPALSSTYSRSLLKGTIFEHYNNKYSNHSVVYVKFGKVVWT